MRWTGIQAEIRSYESRPHTHVHDYAQAVFPLVGALEIEVAGSLTRLKPASAIVIKPGTRHDFGASRNGEFLVVDFDDATLLELLPLGVSYSTAKVACPAHWRYLQFVASELRAFPADSLGRRVLLDAMIRMLAGDEVETPETAATDRKIGYFTMLMERGPGAATSVASVAKEVGMSERSLRRFFIKNSGMSPKTAQLERRFQRAVDLLCSTDLTVAEVAYQIGYDNPSSFSNAFKRHFGITPRQYRLSEE